MFRLLLGTALVGAFSLSGIALAWTPGEPIAAVCAERYVTAWAEFVNQKGSTLDGNPDGNVLTIQCVVDDVEYVIRPENVYGFQRFMGSEWRNGVLDVVPSINDEVKFELSTSSETGWTSLRLKNGCNSFQGQTYYSGYDIYGASHKVYVNGCPNDQAGVEGYKADMGSRIALGPALLTALPWVGTQGFITAVKARFNEGTSDNTLPDGSTVPEPPGTGGGGDEPPPPAGGGTDWGSAPGDAETSCSIIDIPCNLRRLFVPAPDWPQRWSALADERDSVFPFGFFSMIRDALYVHVIDTSPPSFKIELPRLWSNPDSAGTMSVFLNFDEIEGFIWWHETGRTWLYWGLIGAIPILVFRYAMQ